MKLISFTRNIDSNPIRNRLDIIKIILQTNDYLIDRQYSLVQCNERIDKNCPFLYVEKMSRLFIPENSDDQVQKLYSIVFPFSYNVEQNELSTTQIAINNSLNSCLKSIVYSFDKTLPDSMNKIQDFCLEACVDNDFPDVLYEIVVTILTRLLTFDVGYIRYDYDEEHYNGRIHPLHHLDINYTNQSTYKIGLNQSLDILEFKSIIDNQKECWFLHK